MSTDTDQSPAERLARQRVINENDTATAADCDVYTLDWDELMPDEQQWRIKVAQDKLDAIAANEAQIRADERRKVAAEIAQAIDDASIPDNCHCEENTVVRDLAASIARNHAEESPR